MGKNRTVGLFFVTVFVLIFLSYTFPLLSNNNAENDKFNLLLITIDTLRADRLSCYSTEHVKTPAIDSLAAKSTLFTRAFAHTSTTLPSHANILLGTTPLYHGVHDNSNFKVRDEFLTLAEHLKTEGYSTGAFVGAYPLDSIFGLSQGFDTYDGDFAQSVAGQRSNERPAEIVVDKALEYLNQSTSPWFLWIHCYDPHDPYEPPEPFKTKYSGHLYDGEVAYVDSVLKKLFQYLENKDLYENTLIVFTGDHGESLGEHGEETHGFLSYNSSIWVPLMIYSPGIKPQTVKQNVSHIDLFPTICDILHINQPSFLQGTSLTRLINRKKQKESSIYFESLLPYYTMGWAPIRGIIQNNIKFIDSPIPELYDLKKDFDEMRDISQKTNLNIYQKQLSKLIQNQKSQESEGAKQNLNREALEKLKSLGYVGDTVGEKKKTFSRKDDVKVLLPYYNKAVEALDLFHSGNEDKGIKLLREVITEKKNISSAYLNLAEIFKLKGRLSSAISVLRMGFDFIPESFQIYSSFIKYLLEANQWNEIINVFQKIPIEQAEFDPLVWNYVGVAYLNIGDFDKALQFCEKGASIDDRNAISYNNLGSIHLNIFNLSKNPESLQKALLNYQKVIELDPKISAAHDGISFIYMFEKKYDKAIYHLEAALQIQPDLDNIVYNLGVAYLKKGDKTKALSFFNQFKGGNSYQQMTSTEKEKLENYILQCKKK